MHSYSVAEDKQGSLQVAHTWKDAVQDAIKELTQGKDLGILNWDKNHYLGNIKVSPFGWRSMVRSIYKKLVTRTPARDYILTDMFKG
jgi:hypothetical protein